MEIGSSHRRGLGWKGFAIAATMLIATGTVLLLLPKVQSAREAARRTTPMANSHATESAASPQHLTDDVQHFQPGEEFKLGVTPHVIIQEEEEAKIVGGDAVGGP